jgi:7-carboxy-7-deazaguanine synthase
MKLRVNEIFYSIQGETVNSGFTSLFIRTSGCNLNCTYCDTEYARESGEYYSIPRLVEIAAKYEYAHHITITGGEPLLQVATIPLISALLEKKYSVQLETNGSLPIKDVPLAARKILDVKTPSSGEIGSFLIKNLDYLGYHDEIKFVIANDTDYEFSCDFIKKNIANSSAIINFSPERSQMPPAKLAGRILEDRLHGVRLNLQIHRCIWGDHEPGTYVY